MLKLQTLPTHALARSARKYRGALAGAPGCGAAPDDRASRRSSGRQSPGSTRRRGTSPTSTSTRRSAARSLTATTRSAATSPIFRRSSSRCSPLRSGGSSRPRRPITSSRPRTPFAASLVAVPIYLLARWLGLGRGYSYLCAAYGLLIPAVSLASENISDLVAYPLVLAAVAVGVRALDTPSPKRQVAFLAFATLATLARTQYFVLVPAYILAALLLERRRMFRAHKVAVLALIPIAVAITVAVLGFYSGVRSTTHLNAEFFKWLALQSFLLALAAGVAIVPGARDRIRPADPPPGDRLLAPRRLLHRAAVLRVGGVRGELGRLQGALPLHRDAAARARIRRLPEARPAAPLRGGRPRRGHRRGRVAPADLRLRDLHRPHRLASFSTASAGSSCERATDRRRLRSRSSPRWPAHSRSGRRSRATDAAWRSAPRSLVAVAATIGAVKIDLSDTRATRALLPAEPQLGRRREPRACHGRRDSVLVARLPVLRPLLEPVDQARADARPCRSDGRLRRARTSGSAATGGCSTRPGTS